MNDLSMTVFNALSDVRIFNGELRAIHEELAGVSLIVGRLPVLSAPARAMDADKGGGAPKEEPKKQILIDILFFHASSEPEATDAAKEALLSDFAERLGLTEESAEKKFPGCRQLFGLPKGENEVAFRFVGLYRRPPKSSERPKNGDQPKRKEQAPAPDFACFIVPNAEALLPDIVAALKEFDQVMSCPKGVGVLELHINARVVERARALRLSFSSCEPKISDLKLPQLKDHNAMAALRAASRLNRIADDCGRNSLHVDDMQKHLKLALSTLDECVESNEHAVKAIEADKKDLESRLKAMRKELSDGVKAIRKTIKEGELGTEVVDVIYNPDAVIDEGSSLSYRHKDFLRHGPDFPLGSTYIENVIEAFHKMIARDASKFETRAKEHLEHFLNVTPESGVKGPVGSTITIDTPAFALEEKLRKDLRELRFAKAIGDGRERQNPSEVLAAWREHAMKVVGLAKSAPLQITGLLVVASPFLALAVTKKNDPNPPPGPLGKLFAELGLGGTDSWVTWLAIFISSCLIVGFIISTRINVKTRRRLDEKRARDAVCGVISKYHKEYVEAYVVGSIERLFRSYEEAFDDLAGTHQAALDEEIDKLRKQIGALRENIKNGKDRQKLLEGLDKRTAEVRKRAEKVSEELSAKISL